MKKQEYPRIIQTDSEEIFPLTGRIVTIGSSAECAIRLQRAGIAPRATHFMFIKGAYCLQPVGSDTHLAVNGKPIKNQQQLKHGDNIAIGKIKFVYQEHEEPLGDKGEIGGGITGHGAVEELINIVLSLLKNREQDVFEDLVTSVSRLMKCDAARLVGEDVQSGKRDTIARYPINVGLDRFSNRAIDWARDSSKAVLMHDTDWLDDQKPLASLEKNLVASIICAPLKYGDRILGYLYLDRLRDNDPFSENERSFCDVLVPLFSEILIDVEERRLQRETIARLQSRSGEAGSTMIYGSKIMQDLIAQAQKFARTESPVLILGETGTGKELIARFIHEQSPRSKKSFRAINCGAIPENLVESELFGHEKGAFTGAAQRKIGLLESADGGTVLLDEIGELPLQLQVKLLRFLQESEIVRVGGTETKHVDIRIIAATNRNLEEDVDEGRFRQDLFFRLNVLTVSMPPLRERENDIILLAEYFVGKYCEQFGLPRKVLSTGANEALSAYPWPGNIRELDNVIQKTILTTKEKKIEAGSLVFPQSKINKMSPDMQRIVTLKEARNEAESNIIRHVLGKTGGNVSKSAKMLKIDRKWLMKKMEELGISADMFRA